MVCQEMVELALRTKQDAAAVVVNFLCQLVCVTWYPDTGISFTPSRRCGIDKRLALCGWLSLAESAEA